MKNDVIYRFKSLVEDKDVIELAKMYYNYAYMFQKEFNKILDENNMKEGVIDIMYKVCNPEYADQI